MRIPTAFATTVLFAVAPLSPAGAAVDPAEAAAAIDTSACELVALDLPADLPTSFTVTLPIDGVDAALVLHRRSVRSPDFVALVEREGGVIEPVAPPLPRTYRGEVYLQGHPDTSDAIVAASLTGDGLYAYLRLPGDRVYGIQPLAELMDGVPPQVHVVYREADNLPSEATCGVTEPSAAPPANDGPLFGTAKEICEIAYDADVEFYNQNGSSVTSTITDIENVQNAVEAIYEDDLDITYAITAVLVRTAEPDPYDSTDPGTLLNQFRTHWNNNHKDIKRDITHLMTGKNIDGSVIGIASLSVVCKSGYGLSQSKFTGNFTSRVGLTAHELGHNWGSGHCSGSGCFIMCPSLGGCGPVTLFGNFAITSINAYKATVNCLENDAGPLPLPFFDQFAVPTLEPSYWSANDSADDVLTSGQNEPSSPYALRLESSGGGANQQGEVTSVPLALLGEVGATLSYHCQHVGVESGESLVVEYLDVNQAWVEVDRVVSDGVDESDFELRSFLLGADAQHDQFRVRFRVEGNSTNDDWFIDDITVGPPPPGPPSITSITPSDVQILFGDTLQVQGDNFETPSLSITVGGIPLIPFFEYFVIDNSRVDIKPPSLPALGASDVVVTNSEGFTPPFPINVVPSSPPRLIGPPWIVNTQTLNLQWGGQPGDLAFLLVGLSNNTLPFNGQSLLDFLFLVPVAPLDANGLGGFTAPFDGAPAGAILYHQLLTVPPPGTNPSQAQVSNVFALLVLI